MTISTSLLQIVLKKNVTAKDMWTSLKNLFHDNKVTTDLLSNIDAVVDEKTLVMYAINGLGDLYDHAASASGYWEYGPNQDTTLPRAFNTMSFRYSDNNEDSGWYMDTGTASHLFADPDGSLSHYKARLVANGRSQQQGIDCDETFSPLVKPATIRTVLSLAVYRQWPIHQLDVKNSFFHGYLSETVYMYQPPSFTDPSHPDYVCHLHISLYGLKQAPYIWFQRFASIATLVSFQHNKRLLQRIISSLHREFSMTDIGPLNYFLGISFTRTPMGMFLSQSKYAIEILERANMIKCKPCKTPVDT
ncbi:ribonuclease H-like domain-containing protein [Tanacetum coccineum]|uniref:Ribonuclease H-like domain-containing protein n=1 Tax=Tanacetum coccineum TaxID=301880 RepID=A0ABQ5A8B3_9ASTR